MNDLKIVSDAPSAAPAETSRTLPVPTSDAGFTRRDLDLIKRDLITVRKDYSEIRNNLIVLTHQHSSAPTRSFFIVSGLVWLGLLAILLIFEPQLGSLGERVLAHLPHR